MRIRRSRVARFLLVAFCAASLSALSACGGGSSSSTEAGASSAPQQQADTASAANASSTAADSSMQKVNLNTGTSEEFGALPGVGEQMVHEFEEYRPYVSIQQFRQEIGKYVDEDQVATYEQYVFVPIRYNESDAATLQQIPGLDAQEAQQLMDARPYDSRSAFLDALSGRVSAEEQATAETYLSDSGSAS